MVNGWNHERNRFERVFVMRMSRMNAELRPAGGDLTYTYRPSLLGAPWEFKLTGHGIEWSAGRQSGRVAFAKVRRMRMSYRPANMQSYRFVTEIWADAT